MARTWPKSVLCPKLVITFLLIAVAIPMIVSEFMTLKAQEAMKITAELKNMADEHPDLVNIFEDDLDEIMFQMGSSAATMGAESKSECGTALIKVSTITVFNKCAETRKVTIKCQGKKGECVIPPNGSDKCGECGPPTIVKDDYDDGGTQEAPNLLMA